MWTFVFPPGGIVLPLITTTVLSRPSVLPCFDNHRRLVRAFSVKGMGFLGGIFRHAPRMAGSYLLLLKCRELNRVEVEEAMLSCDAACVCEYGCSDWASSD